MLFQFSRFNHGRQGKIIVEDITRIMAAQIEAIGGETVHSDGPFIGKDLGYNVVLEAFDDPEHVQMIADASVDCRFIIVATEEPTDDGFNGGFDPAMRRRQDVFPTAAKHADAILHLVPGAHVTRWYSQFAPTASVELGHAASLVQANGEDRPEFDFGFFGKMTWRRRKMLDRLGPSTLVIETLDVPREQRDAMMRRCRVVVQILAEEKPDGTPCGMVSSTRCATALMLGRPVIAQPHPNSAPWDQIVHFAPSIDRFYEDAVVACRMWQACHRQQFEMFERLLTPEVCVGAPLRSIGII